MLLLEGRGGVLVEGVSECFDLLGEVGGGLSQLLLRGHPLGVGLVGLGLSGGEVLHLRLHRYESPRGGSPVRRALLQLRLDFRECIFEGIYSFAVLCYVVFRRYQSVVVSGYIGHHGPLSYAQPADCWIRLVTGNRGILAELVLERQDSRGGQNSCYIYCAQSVSREKHLRVESEGVAQGNLYLGENRLIGGS